MGPVDLCKLTVSWSLWLTPVSRMMCLIRRKCLQDPGNLGTLLRTAAGLGWSCLMLEGCCDAFNDKVIRAARGAAWRAPLAAATLPGLLQELSSREDYDILVADMGTCARASSTSIEYASTLLAQTP